MDAVHSDYDGAPTDGSAWEDERWERRIVRGDYRFEAANCRSDKRDWMIKSGNRALGFRVVAAKRTDIAISDFVQSQKADVNSALPDKGEEDNLLKHD